MQDRLLINKVLGRFGLGQLEDPGLLSQLGFLVENEEHFRQMLTKCEPQHRKAMYDALSPNLRFKAKPLDQYISQSKDLADREQLPIWDQANQTFKPYRAAEIQTIEGILAAEVAKYVLTVNCRKCTREESFSGITKADAVQAARDAGWVYSALGEGIEICPKCPASRMAA